MWMFQTGCMYDCRSICLDHVSSAWKFVEFVGTYADMLWMSWSEDVRLGVICNSVDEVVCSEQVSALWGDNYTRDVSIRWRCGLVHCYLWGILYMKNAGMCAWLICVRVKSLVKLTISSIWIKRMTRSRWKFRICTTTLILYSFPHYIFLWPEDGPQWPKHVVNLIKQTQRQLCFGVPTLSKLQEVM